MKQALPGLLFLLLANLAPAAQPRQPFDVLFIAIDDLNDWVGPLGGHPQTQTPNIDRLAAMGMTFTNAQAASAVCHSSRTAILTGLRPTTSGIYDNDPDWRGQPVFEGKPTLPRHFRDHGYLTRGAGKIFHAHTYVPSGVNGFNDTTAWDAFFPSLTQQLPKELDPPKVPASGGSWGRTFDWAGLEADDLELGDGQVTAWVAERITEQGGEGPRFNAAGIYRPHLPWYVPQSYLDRFPVEQVLLPPHIQGDLDDVPQVAKRQTLNSTDIHNWMRDKGHWQAGVQAYLASIHYADAMVGRLLHALQASGRADRTIIVLWSDHGFHLGEKERWRKFTLWKESLHVPFIVVAPGVTKPGSRSHAPVSTIDLYPTLVELAGLPLPAHLDGRSLVPLLQDPAREWNHPTLSSFRFGNHAVVSEQYKYIRYADGSEELYDVRSDPNEWNNLAGDAGLGSVKTQLGSHIPQQVAPDLSRGRPGARPPAAPQE